MDTQTTAGKVAQEERRNNWREHLERQPASGKNVKAYCAEKGLKPWQFFYWRNALHPKLASTAGFVELRQAETRSRMQIEVGGARIGVDRGFDAETLRQVIRALRTA